jgi:arginine dihydrolase
MCPPEHFGVHYRINPWMDPSVSVDRPLALRQWEGLVGVYRSLGHEVSVIEPVPGQPDMVFCANAGLVLDHRVLLARFRHRERRGEESAYRAWFVEHGYAVRASRHVNEGEGDFAPHGTGVLGAWGFRTSRRALGELEAVFQRPVAPLRLADPRFYHLDTALFVLDSELAYYPPAFTPVARQCLERIAPGAIVADEVDADVLGLNAFCDGHHVVLAIQARGLTEQVRARGYEPIGVDVSEFLKAGGGVKCCTLELRDT